MADLDRAIADAREAVNSYMAGDDRADSHDCAWRLRDLLAALDAARGQAVAWRALDWSNEPATSWTDGTPPPGWTSVQLAYAAPPAAAVPREWDAPDHDAPEYAHGYAEGWNNCRAAALAGKEGE